MYKLKNRLTRSYFKLKIEGWPCFNSLDYYYQQYHIISNYYSFSDTGVTNSTYLISSLSCAQMILISLTYSPIFQFESNTKIIKLSFLLFHVAAPDVFFGLCWMLFNPHSPWHCTLLRHPNYGQHQAHPSWWRPCLYLPYS